MSWTQMDYQREMVQVATLVQLTGLCEQWAAAALRQGIRQTCLSALQDCRAQLTRVQEHLAEWAHHYWELAYGATPPVGAPHREGIKAVSSPGTSYFPEEGGVGGPTERKPPPSP